MHPNIEFIADGLSPTENFRKQRTQHTRILKCKVSRSPSVSVVSRLPLSRHLFVFPVSLSLPLCRNPSFPLPAYYFSSLCICLYMSILYPRPPCGIDLLSLLGPNPTLQHAALLPSSVQEVTRVDESLRSTCKGAYAKLGLDSVCREKNMQGGIANLWVSVKGIRTMTSASSQY